MVPSTNILVGYLRSLLARQGGAASNDCELLRSFIERRDNDAFAVLMHRHGPMVLNLARRLTGDEQLAEDVFQATFLLLSRKAQTIRRAESLSCWLHGAAHRFALQAQRKRQRRQAREAHARISSPSTPLDELTAQEFLDILDEELENLPENQRAPLILCCLEGLSQEEAARRLGCSANAVKGRLERGRQRLRMRLEKRGLTLPAVLGGSLLLAGSTSPVPAALTQTTLQSAITEVGIAPSVAALIQEAMRSMVINKLKAIGAIVMLFALTGTSVGIMSLNPQAAKENAPATADDKLLSAKKGVDLNGDPLPDGAVMRLGTLQRRAVGARLAVTADGKSIISVRNANYIRIWDVETGKMRQAHELPSTIPFLSALSPDGRWLANHGGRNDTLTIWNVQSGKAMRNLVVANAQSIHSVVFAPDGGRLAAITFDGKDDYALHVWQLADGKEIFIVKLKHRWGCQSLSFSADGKLLLASFGTTDAGTVCWEVASGQRKWQIKNFGNSSMRLTPDGLILCWLTPNFSVRSLTTGEPVNMESKVPFRDLQGDVSISPDGRTFVTMNGRRMSVWDMVHGKQMWTQSGSWSDAVFLPDSKSFIASNGSLQRWETATGKTFWSDTSDQGHTGEVISLAFSADGRRLVSGSVDGSVRLWDTATGRPLRIWHRFKPDSFTPGVQAVDLTADGQWILVAGGNGRLKLCHAEKAEEIREFAWPPREELGQNVVARMEPDGTRVTAFIRYGPVFSTSDDSGNKATAKLAMWETKTAKLLALHRFDAVATHYGTLSRDGRTALILDRLVDVASGKQLARLQGLDPRGAVFSPDGALVMGIRKDDRINYRNLCLWESATAQIVLEPRTETWMTHTVFHPSQRFFASNDTNDVQVRELQTGKTTIRLRMPEHVQAGNHNGFSSGFAECFAFTVDGRRLATGMPDGTILLWDISLPPSNPNHLERKELKTLWDDLADFDAAKAWRAVWRMSDAPQDALAFLRGHVKPYPAAAEGLMRKLLADLDSDSFADREAAVKRLKELGLQAEPALRAALKANPSLEQRRRIEELLAALPETTSPPMPEELRQLRALIVLERIGTSEARRMLEDVAKGPESACLTRQARAALMCLR